MRNFIYSTLRKFRYSHLFGLRNLINQAYYDPYNVVVRSKNIDYVVVDGCKFYPSDQLDELRKIKGNPWFDNIHPTDTAVDIGANIGAVTIPLAMVAERVYAIEPLFYKQLEANINLNGLKNIQVMPYGLGSGKVEHIEFSSKADAAIMVSFQYIRARAGHIDFLKVDCEGAEWGLQPEWLKGIPEIRIEFHLRRSQNGKDKARLDCWYKWFNDNGYKLDVDVSKPYNVFTPIERCAVVKASLREK